jgi:hypothetical protein
MPNLSPRRKFFSLTSSESPKPRESSHLAVAKVFQVRVFRRTSYRVLVPCAPIVLTYRSLFLRRALPFARRYEGRNPTRKVSTSGHRTPVMFAAKAGPIRRRIFSPKEGSGEMSNSNSVANRNSRNSLIQKEKTFSNRNKKRIFPASLCSLPGCPFQPHFRPDRLRRKDSHAPV